MTFDFYKYQGTGNDFILLDNRSGRLPEAGRATVFARWCDRHRGIGADGVILLEEAGGYDFYMRYFNADGGESSMCGNGGRCVVAFARAIDAIITHETEFLAADGPHKARILPDGRLRLGMSDVEALHPSADKAWTVDTGSPHYVTFTDDLEELDVFAKGREIRNSAPFGKEGINVNFLAQKDGAWHLRTYERGVEDETLSCGTGVTAAALVAHACKGASAPVAIQSRGGALEVDFKPAPQGGFKDIWLTGPAVQVFRGQVDWLRP